MESERAGNSEIQLSVEEFEQILPKICDEKISYVPDHWTPENPLCGVCIPVALVAKRLFGGKLLRADLKPFPKFKYMYWHWANLLPNGEIKDFTESQFGDDYPQDLDFVEKPSSTITRHSNVVMRSNLLYKRLLRKIKNV